MPYTFRPPILLIGALLAVSTISWSQQVAPKNTDSAHTTAKPRAHTPDLSGVWDTQNPRGFQPNTAAFPGEIPPLTPWGQAQFEATRPAYGPRAVPDSTDPVNPTKLGAHGCFPPGVPRIYLHPVPMEIFQIPGRVWEGDTFVVDTIGFNDKTWLDRLGHRHSEDLHVVERFRRVDHDTLQDDITMEDAKTLTMPWKTHVIFALRPDWEILEHACADNANFDENLQMQGQGK